MHDVTTGTIVRVVVNGEVPNKPCYLKTWWQHTLQKQSCERLLYKINLNETTFAVRWSSARQSWWHATRCWCTFWTARQSQNEYGPGTRRAQHASGAQTRGKRQKKQEQLIKMERILQAVLRKSTLSARVGQPRLRSTTGWVNGLDNYLFVFIIYERSVSAMDIHIIIIIACANTLHSRSWSCSVFIHDWYHWPPSSVYVWPAKLSPKLLKRLQWDQRFTIAQYHGGHKTLFLLVDRWSLHFLGSTWVVNDLWSH